MTEKNDDYEILSGWRLAEACEIAGLSKETARNWRRAGYFPRPKVEKEPLSVPALVRLIVMTALVRAANIKPHTAATIVSDPASLGDQTMEELGLQSEADGHALMFWIQRAKERARALHEARTRKDMLIAPHRRTRISRGEHDTAGVCVQGFTVLISEGRGGLALAAELAPEDAEKILADMDAALEEGAPDSVHTTVHAFERAHLAAVFIGRPLSIAIGAGPKGAIVARLTRDDFKVLRDELRAALRSTARLEFPADEVIQRGAALPISQNV